MPNALPLTDAQDKTAAQQIVLGQASAHRLDSSNSCNTYDFGFHNPQLSDCVLHLHRERNVESGAEPSSAPAETPLLNMHVNSLTLAANSEIFRYRQTTSLCLQSGLQWLCFGSACSDCEAFVEYVVMFVTLRGWCRMITACSTDISSG